MCLSNLSSFMKTLNKLVKCGSIRIMKRRYQGENEQQSKSKIPFWALRLRKTMKDPNYVVKSDDKVTMIKDMYNKAQFHYLVLPNEDISSLEEIEKDQVYLLEHMEKIGREYVVENHPDFVFKYGYHSEASMHHLHLHIISDDMNSPCLKTKKHWNSFTTGFFLESKDVIENLKKYGQVIIPPKEKCKEYMNAPLKCHKCSFKPKNMPDLKNHILTHLNRL